MAFFDENTVEEFIVFGIRFTLSANCGLSRFSVSVLAFAKNDPTGVRPFLSGGRPNKAV
jgi:hypothetical protein